MQLVFSMTEGLQVLDTKSLAKLATFRRQEQDWAQWCFAFESYTSLLGRNLRLAMETNMEAEPVSVPTAPKQRAVQPGTCRQCLDERRTAERNGSLVGEEAGARATTPRTACQHVVGSPRSGSGELRGRYLHVHRYEVQSGETLSDSLRVAEVSRHSPQNIQAALWSHIMTIGSDYQRLRTFVNDLLTSGLEYNSSGFRANLTSANNAPVPMDVGNLCTGTGKGAQDKGKRNNDRGSKENGKVKGMSKTGKVMGTKELRRKVNVWNLQTQTCQPSTETYQCSQCSCDSIFAASSIKCQQCCSIYCRCVDQGRSLDDGCAIFINECGRR